MNLRFFSHIDTPHGWETVCVNGYVDREGKPQVIVTDIDEMGAPLNEITGKMVKVLRNEYILRVTNLFRQV